MKLDFRLSICALWLCVMGCNDVDQSALQCGTASSGSQARNAHLMFSDRSSEQLIVLGGADSEQVCGSLLRWDGSTWKTSSEGGPTRRTFAAGAQDATSNNYYVFGGNSVLFGKRSIFGKLKEDTILSDFWIRRPSGWSEISPDVSPPARAEAAMAFDPVDGTLLIFGGYYLEGGETKRLGDTWEWDGQDWTQHYVSGPVPQNGASMVFDEAQGLIVLVGRDGNTWEWDEGAWRLVPAAKIEPLYNAVAAYDRDRQGIVLFGGWTGSDRSAKTWLYRDGEWTVIYDSGPLGRNHSAITLDLKTNYLTLFGGHDGENIFTDIWALEPNGWVSIYDRGSIKRISNDH